MKTPLRTAKWKREQGYGLRFYFVTNPRVSTTAGRRAMEKAGMKQGRSSINRWTVRFQTAKALREDQAADAAPYLQET